MGEKGTYRPVRGELEYPEAPPPTRNLLVLGDARCMRELNDGQVHLVVTSPPYPMLKMWDPLFTRLGCRNFSEMHDLLEVVWRECYRVLCDGGIICVNIGDALRRADGGFRLFANHAEVIRRCEAMGFTTLPYILWRKPVNRPRYRGRGNFLGSGFLPPNAYVTLDCEYILLFRKGGLRRFVSKDPVRYASAFSREERDRWFTQVWDLLGERQTLSEVERRVGAFPEEIPYRLIRMFSVIGDTVLDPFCGTGTTLVTAARLGRNSVGYEIDRSLATAVRQRFFRHLLGLQVIEREDVF